MLRLKGKRGVSPLIATVLLIAFSVALGAVVMQWGKAYVEETTETATRQSEREISCTLDVKLGVIDIGGHKKICYKNDPAANEHYVEVTIENGPNIELQDVRVNIIGTDDVFTKESLLTGPLARSAPKKLRIDYNETVGDAEQIKIVPKISLPATKQETFCSDSVLTLEDFGTC